MKKYTIIADSCCDLRQSDFYSEKFDFVTVPICIIVGDVNYIDDESLNTKGLVSALKTSNSFKTAAPSPEIFAEEMRKGENVICITLSSKLSGTYNCARIAADEVRAESPEKNIFVLDSLSASSAMANILFKLKDLLENEENISFKDVVKRLEAWSLSTKVRFVLQDFGNLVKTGRMSKLSSIIASALPIKLICGDNGAGEIKMFSKAMGMKGALKALSEFPLDKAEKEGKDLHIIISHCHNEKDADTLKNFLCGFGFRNIKVFLMRGIASIYASDKGLSVAY